VTNHHASQNFGASIVRFPHGVWAAVAALPIGSTVQTFVEIEDERPLRYEAFRRIAPSLGPIVSRPSVALAGVADRGRIWSAIQAAKKTADVMADREIRQRLLSRLAAKMSAAARVAENVYRARPIMGGLDPSSKLHVIVGETLARIDLGDPTILNTVVELAQRMNFDPRAKRFVVELIQHARISPVRQKVANIFRMAGFGDLSRAVTQ